MCAFAIQSGADPALSQQVVQVAVRPVYQVLDPSRPVDAVFHAKAADQMSFGNKDALVQP